jgi:hypothetical protein
MYAESWHSDLTKPKAGNAPQKRRGLRPFSLANSILATTGHVK